MSAGNHPYAHYPGVPASDQQHLSVDALATTTTTTAPPGWPQESAHHPSRHPSHALYVASEPANLFHYAAVAAETIIPAWPPDYTHSELRQWDPYAHQNPTAEPSHALSLAPHQTVFSSAEGSNELFATWQPRQQYTQHPANALVSSEVSTRQNSPSTSSWPGLDLRRASSANAAFESGSKLNQHWVPGHSLSDQGEYMHRQVSSTDPSESPPKQLQGHQQLRSQKKPAKIPSSFVERQEKAKVSKRKGPLLEEQRERTHKMRKHKRICVRCRFYKSGVCYLHSTTLFTTDMTSAMKAIHARSVRKSLDTPGHFENLAIENISRTQVLCGVVCHSYLSDHVYFLTLGIGNGREHQEQADFLCYDWIYNSQLYEMEILWNLPKHGPISGARPMRITYRPYTAKRGHRDLETSVWMNREGNMQQLLQPPYAVYDTANLVPAFDRYFASLQPGIEEWIFARIQQDQVALLTYQEAVRMRDEKGSKALGLAMRLQGLSVVSQGYGSVVSNDTPGIREYDYRALGTSHYEAYERNSRDRPLPGAITHQMDVAAVKCMAKLEKAFVKELAALIFKPKIKPWYELFLTFFVIFWNLEYIQRGAQDYIKSKKGTVSHSINYLTFRPWR